MKRLLCSLLILCLVPALAFCVDEVETLTYGHNQFAPLTGAHELTGEPEVTPTSTGAIYSYTVEGVDVGFIVKDGRVSICFCRAKEEFLGEFLSQATSALYNICGADSISYWYPNLFDQFLTARAGNVSETKPFIDKVCIFEMERENGLYTFMAAKLY